LIPDYVVGWSHQFQSRDRAFKARNVIDTLIKNERDRQQRDGGQDYYSNVEISQADWETVKNFNDIIGVSTVAV
jgi:hypothetical protein